MSEAGQIDISLGQFLLHDEVLFAPPPYTNGDLRRALGYQLYSIRDAQKNEGKSLLLEMPEYGDCVEPVKLISGAIRADKAVSTVRAVRGQGLLIIQNGPANGIVTRNLSAESAKPTNLHVGMQFAYVNTGKEPFVVRDDSESNFSIVEEIPATSQKMLGFLSLFSEKFAQHLRSQQ